MPVTSSKGDVASAPVSLRKAGFSSVCLSLSLILIEAWSLWLSVPLGELSISVKGEWPLSLSVPVKQRCPMFLKSLCEKDMTFCLFAPSEVGMAFVVVSHTEGGVDYAPVSVVKDGMGLCFEAQ